jgi:hypothetical protein
MHRFASRLTALAAIALFAAYASAQAGEMIARKVYVDPTILGSAALEARDAVLLCELTRHAIAAAGIAELVHEPDDADCLVSLSYSAASSPASLKVRFEDRLFPERSAEMEFPLSQGMYEAFGTSIAAELGRHIAEALEPVPQKVRTEIIDRVVSEVVEKDLSKGIAITIRALPGTSLVAPDGTSLAVGADGTVRVEGVPQESMLVFVASLEGYYDERVELRAGRDDVEAEIAQRPMPRFEVAVQELGANGLVPQFGWAPIPERLLVFVRLANNALPILLADEYAAPPIWFVQPELGALWIFGEPGAPLRLAAGLSLGLRFDYSAVADVAGLSTYCPFALRMEGEFRGGIGGGLSFFAAYRPAIVYLPETVLKSRALTTGEEQSRAWGDFNYDKSISDGLYLGGFWYVNIVEISLGLAFSF